MLTPSRRAILAVTAVLAAGVCVPIAARPTARAQDVPSIAFEPVSQSVAVGTSVTLKVNIEQAANLAAFQLTIQYDARLLGRGAITAGDFLSQTGRPVTAFEPVELVPGTVLYQVLSGPSELPGASGAGTLASIVFTPLAEGLSLVSLPEVILLDTAGNPTTVAGRNATLRLLPPPTASPSPTPAPLVHVMLPLAFAGRR